jgi:hypothetical protein
MVVDNAGQKLAHRAMLLVLGLALGLVIVLRSVPRAALAPGVWAGRLVVVLAAVGVLFYATQPREKWVAYLAGLAAVGLAFGLGLSLTGRRWNRALGVLVALLLAALLLPGWFMRLDLSHREWNIIEIIEAHYSLVLSSGDRLAAGLRLGDDVSPAYGVILPLITATIERQGGELSLHGYMLLTHLLQAIYLLAAAHCYYVYARRRWVFCLFALLFVAVPYHFNNPFYLCGTPNHTAWRYVGFPLACLCLVLLRNALPGRCAFLLGAASGVGLLLNLETGVAAAAGLLVYLLFRYGGPGQDRRLVRLTRLFGLHALGGLTAFASFAVVSLLLLGALPTIASLKDFFHVMKVATESGYAGGRGLFHPLAILLVAHSSLALVHAWLERSRGVSSFTCLRAAVAVMLLTWFSYYANRPHMEYLTCFFVLYAFLIVDAVRTLIAARRRSLPAWPALGAAGLLALVLVPHFLSTVKAQWPLYRDGLRLIVRGPDENAATLLSGVYFPNGRRAAVVREKAAFLSEVGRKGPVIYFTVDSYLVPKLSGVWSAVPMSDVYWESTTRRQYNKLLKRVVSSGAEKIYFDSEESVIRQPSPRYPRPTPSIPGLLEFHRQLRQDLSRYYERESVVHGWERWRRRPRS